MDQFDRIWPEAPTPGPWIITDDGKIVAANAKVPDLEFIADVQTAPQGARNIPIICAASLMFEALKLIRRDPAHKRLGSKALEALNDALGAAE